MRSGLFRSRASARTKTFRKPRNRRLESFHLPRWRIFTGSAILFVGLFVLMGSFTEPNGRLNGLQFLSSLAIALIAGFAGYIIGSDRG